MCDHYRLKNPDAASAECQRLFGIPLEGLEPCLNNRPSQMLPVIATDVRGKARAARMRWGFIAHWMTSDGQRAARNDTRAETAFDKPLFKHAIQKRRCLVPVDGFYEWRKPGVGGEQGYDLRRRDGGPFFLAGIYEDPTATRPETFLILTAPANEAAASIQEQMPVALAGARAADWLKPGSLMLDQYLPFVQPFRADELEAVPVSAVGDIPAPEHAPAGA